MSMILLALVLVLVSPGFSAPQSGRFNQLSSESDTVDVDFSRYTDLSPVCPAGEFSFHTCAD